MTAVVLLTLALTEPDPGADPDGLSASGEEGEGIDVGWSVDPDALAEVTLADADRDVESITARARTARDGRAAASYWPRLAVSLSIGGALDPALDQTAGAADAWRFLRTRGLVWSVVATWGQP